MKSLTFCAFAITEPGAGSDVAAMAASYRRDGDSFCVINGVQHFIINGQAAGGALVRCSCDLRPQACPA